jgi:hypothetical protein
MMGRTPACPVASPGPLGIRRMLCLMGILKDQEHRPHPPLTEQDVLARLKRALAALRTFMIPFFLLSAGGGENAKKSDPEPLKRGMRSRLKRPMGLFWAVMGVKGRRDRDAEKGRGQVRSPHSSRQGLYRR